MKEILMKAFAGSEEELAEAAKRMKALPADADGIPVTEAIDANCYRAGMLLYPVYMKYETTLNKKAGYMDITAQLKALWNRLIKDYSLTDAAYFAKLLMDTLSVMSPEIYEHYRSLQDLFVATVKLVCDKEKLVMSLFPKEALKYEVADSDKEALVLFGGALSEGCEKELVLSEKYEALAKACMQLR